MSRIIVKLNFVYSAIIDEARAVLSHLKSITLYVSNHVQA